VQPKRHRRAQHAKPISHAAPKPDARSLREIFRRTGNLADPKSKLQRLHDHLVVKHKIIRARQQRQPFQHLARKTPVPRMVFRKLYAEQQIFHQRQPPVGDVFVNRHPPLQRATPQNPRGQHRVELTGCQHRRHRRNQPRRVLIIRMQHHHDIRTPRQRRRVARLLVAAIAPVAVMPDGMNAKLRRQCHGGISTGVIGQDDVIHNVVRNFRKSLPQRRGGIIRGHHDGNAFFVQHFVSVAPAARFVQGTAPQILTACESNRPLCTTLA